MKRTKEKHSLLRRELHELHIEWYSWLDDYDDDDDHDRYYFDFDHNKFSSAKLK